MSDKINILALLFNGHFMSDEEVKTRIEDLTADYNDMVQKVSPNVSLADRVMAHAVAIDMPHSYVEGARQAEASALYESDGGDLFILRSLAFRKGLIDVLNPSHDYQYCM